MWRDCMISKEMIISKHYKETAPNVNVLDRVTVLYCNGNIRQVVLDAEKNALQFQFINNSVHEIDVSAFVELDAVFLSQFGVSVTEDGTRFFIQSWESGLFCFDIQTGALCWHHGRKRAYNLVVNKTELLCQFHDECILLIDINSGDIMDSYPLSCNSVFVPITNNYIIVGPKRNRYIVMDAKLSVKAKIPVKEFNPNFYENYIVQKADFTSNGIKISGVEYSNKSLTTAIRENTLPRLIASSTFARFIEMPKCKHLMESN